MSENIEPKTTRELLIYIRGEISELKTEIRNIRKITFWFGGLAGSVGSGLVMFAVKLLSK